MATRTKYHPLSGGLDVVTPALSLNPGRAIALQNFEPWFNGGYRRIDGFERFDGRPAPSEQSFIGFDVNAVEGLVVGTPVTGATSGATGVVIGVFEATDKGQSDSIGVTQVVGTFVNGESLGIGAVLADEHLRPNAPYVDLGNRVNSGFFTDINEGIDNADSLSGLYCSTEVPGIQVTGGDWGTDIVSQPIETPVSPAGTTITSATLRVRARVNRIGPETDDTNRWSVVVVIPGLIQPLAATFSETDSSLGFVTRQGVSAGPTDISNAAGLEVEVRSLTAFHSVEGNADDMFTLDIDAIEVSLTHTTTISITSIPVLQQAPTQEIEDEFLLAAQDLYRADIDPVPGDGPATAAWRRGSDVFAVRNNVGNTAGVIHVASPAGWTTAGVTMSTTLSFTNGSSTAVPTFIQVGDTVTGATSGATGTVARIILTLGAPATSDAEGYLVLNPVAGAFVDAESINVTGLLVAVANGPSAQFTLAPNGKYRFLNHNFFGGADTYNVYGVNGVGPAFEIDETNLVTPILHPANPITEQPAVNMPNLIEEHRNHLFTSHAGGRLVQSVIGEPLSVNGFLGAAEFGMGDEITGLNSIVGGVLVVTSERESRGLFGKSILDWEMKLIGERTGGKIYTTAKLDTVYGLDDLGITSTQRTQSFGDFIGATVSQVVQPLIDTLRPFAVDSTVVRSSNQYRLYFSGKECLIMYVPTSGDVDSTRGASSRNRVQFGIAQYPLEIASIWSTDDELGAERRYFVTKNNPLDGYVYEDGKGNNFDGEAIESYLRTAYNFIGSPGYRKRFRRVDVEINAGKPLKIQILHDLSFGASAITSSNTDQPEEININAGGGFYDTDSWDEVYWDGQNISSARANLNGTGENVSYLIYNTSATARPFILQGLTTHYDLRRLQR